MSEYIVELIGFIILPIVGWLLYKYDGLHQRCDQAESDLNALKLHVAENYLSRDDFKESIKELKDAILGIYSRLEKLGGRRK